MSLRDRDALKGIPTCSLPKPLFHVGAGFSPHVGAEARSHMNGETRQPSCKWLLR
jgi:hypothetical protein